VRRKNRKRFKVKMRKRSNVRDGSWIMGLGFQVSSYVLSESMCNTVISIPCHYVCV
jgi:hypothetical protein